MATLARAYASATSLVTCDEAAGRTALHPSVFGGTFPRALADSLERRLAGVRWHDSRCAVFGLAAEP